MEKKDIGWIGLGKMGNPMSRNLLKAGYSLSVYDIQEGAVKKLAERGATVAESAVAVARGAKVTISMIPDDKALEDVALGENGVLAGAAPGSIYIDMSTVSPALSSRVAEAAAGKHIKYLRAPVSGSTESAGAGALTILASGPREAFEECKDIFNVMGQKVFYTGEGDEARYLKLLINIMVGITSAMTAEALVFGKKGGLDWEKMIDIINGSVVTSPLIGFKVQLLKEQKFTPAFTVDQMTKDFDLALETGRALNIPLLLTSLTRELYGIMKATGRGGFDYFGLAALAKEMAGLNTGT